MTIDIEGVSTELLKALPPQDLDDLLAFGRPIVFRMGSATVLAEFNQVDTHLSINLAHIDGGGEGVLVHLWKMAAWYARERHYGAIIWSIHALTCARPNPRLQHFLMAHGFDEADHAIRGRILTRRELL